MKEILLKLKESEIELPIYFGSFLAKIPFKFRPGLGNSYKKQKEEIKNFAGYTTKQRQKYILQQFNKIYQHAFENIPFYNDLYQQAGLNKFSIKEFSDIKKVPIIKKKDLLNIPLEARSFAKEGGVVVNTGGSSGKTLSFYLDPNRFGNEWAHIHHIWSHLGYKPTDLKLQFDGRSRVKNLLQYDFIRHSLRYDIYADPFKVHNKLKNILNRYKIKFLHGYPSAIYNFAVFCRDNDPELVQILRKQLKGAFLVSEFPNPVFRDTISKIFQIPTQSFYGHTETCVMAFEKDRPFKFNVLQTYGHAEAIKFSGGEYNLIGTNYFNFASPLIRYDTEDGINDIDESEGFLESFVISSGREGEFILDRNLKKIPLTGLIFGRHHKLFNVAQHVQIQQEKPGIATILYVSGNSMRTGIEMQDLFDASNVAIEFNFREISSPIKTKSGKINLLVS